MNHLELLSILQKLPDNIQLEVKLKIPIITTNYTIVDVAHVINSQTLLIIGEPQDDKN